MSVVLIGMSLLTGLAVGLHFKVLVLVPALCVCLALVIAIELMLGDSFWLTTLLAAIALQAGYVMSSIAARFIASRRRGSYVGPVVPAASSWWVRPQPVAKAVPAKARRLDPHLND